MKAASLLNSRKLFLAPLEGVSDVGFRNLCWKLGAQTTWTEMLRCQSISRKNNSTLELIDTYSNITPTGLQIAARNPQDISQSMFKLNTLALDPNYSHLSKICDIQINLGCPSKELIADGLGPALLKRKKRLLEIFQELVIQRNKSISANENNSSETPLRNIQSVGCKIRLGLNSVEMNSKVYMNSVLCANEAGLDYIVVHARHANQRSSDKPYWEIIREIKQASEIPVIGNGSVLSVQDAIRMFEMTGCDGIMIARGAMKNPWIFRGIANYFNRGGPAEDYWPSLDELEDANNEYLSYVDKYPKRNKKYEEYHKLNFYRILEAVKEQNFNKDILNPSKIYI